MGTDFLIGSILFSFVSEGPRVFTVPSPSPLVPEDCSPSHVASLPLRSVAKTPPLVLHISKPLSFVTGASSLLSQVPGLCLVFLWSGRDPFFPKVISFPFSHCRPLAPMLLFLRITRGCHAQSRICFLVRACEILSRLYAGVFFVCV